jgi:hypothetical protein
MVAEERGKRLLSKVKPLNCFRYSMAPLLCIILFSIGSEKKKSINMGIAAMKLKIQVKMQLNEMHSRWLGFACESETKSMGALSLNAI